MCIACETKLNPEALEAFGERFIEILNHAALANMISIGHRTGLFDAMSRTGAASSEEIAIEANLNERYVREWLGAVTCGGIVECDETGTRFELPPTHAALLSKETEGECMAHLAQFTSLFGGIEDQLEKCFLHGGGIPYSAYPRFHEIMAEDSAQTIVDPLFEHILPLAPGVVEKLEAGIEVLDVGCGRGRALLAMAERFPQSRFTGYDLSDEAMRWANTRAVDRGLDNIVFEQRDLTTFHEDSPREAFAFITAFDAVHDQARPDHLLAGIHRALTSDGTFLMQDIAGSSNVAEDRSHPIGTLLYSISCSHCMTVSLAQDGLGLGAMWGEKQARRFLNNAGFSNVQRQTLEHDFQNYYYLARK